MELSLNFLEIGVSEKRDIKAGEHLLIKTSFRFYYMPFHLIDLYCYEKLDTQPIFCTPYDERETKTNRRPGAGRTPTDRQIHDSDQIR